MKCVAGDEYTTALNSSESNTKKKKILFIDDDPDTTWIFKTALERNGFQVQAFESPMSALENSKAGTSTNRIMSNREKIFPKINVEFAKIINFPVKAARQNLA